LYHNRHAIQFLSFLGIVHFNIEERADSGKVGYFFAAFFRRSIHRFFISSDNRLRPSALKCPRPPARRDRTPLAARLAKLGDRTPSAAKARSIQVRSAFNSETIVAIFNLSSLCESRIKTEIL
jgi:hypothetical protein